MREHGHGEFAGSPGMDLTTAVSVFLKQMVNDNARINNL